MPSAYDIFERRGLTPLELVDIHDISYEDSRRMENLLDNQIAELMNVYFDDITNKFINMAPVTPGARSAVPRSAIRTVWLPNGRSQIAELAPTQPAGPVLVIGCPGPLEPDPPIPAPGVAAPASSSDQHIAQPARPAWWAAIVSAA
ncbi:hypothetical protein Asera_60430 [Actinocatenispora sera]|uniref:Uncharacterized protein n=2 Tax=Actinocatenispora sera TaxID=390989 RepID=A0A810LAN8_9ACTN|nr:hypothetical protein Asera_60430 [Actinocatenispora sera]